MMVRLVCAPATDNGSVDRNYLRLSGTQKTYTRDQRDGRIKTFIHLILLQHGSSVFV